MPKLPQLLDEQTYNTIDLAATQAVFQAMAKEGALGLTAFDHAMLGPALTMGLRGLRVDERKRLGILTETEKEAKKWWKDLEVFGDIKRGKAIAPGAQALQRLLYDRLEAPVQFSREGRPTCGRDALNRIIEHAKSSEDAIACARVALELRRLEEDRKVLQKPLGPDGRMHTGFGVAATVTGRWSSSRDPFGQGANLHALSRRVRSIFIPDPGMEFVSLDLAQAESKIVAYLAGSQWYKDAHEQGNVHALVGARIWPDAFLSKELAKSTPLPWDPDRNYYDLAKRTQHGFNYKLGAMGFARQGKVPLALAREIRAGYFELVPEVASWHLTVAKELRATHRLTTPMGRERLFLGRTWEESTIKEAIAYVPQSTVSDINKIKLWRIWRALDPHSVQVLLEIHDSVLFQMPRGRVDTIRDALKLAKVEVPFRDGSVCVIPDEVQVGMNWGDWDPEHNPEGLRSPKGGLH